jgi:hypothetical protein
MKKILLSVVALTMLWTSCSEENVAPKNGADASAKKPTPGAYVVTSSLDGYTLSITVDQSATQAASHILLQLVDCDGAYVTPEAVVSSSIPVTFTTGTGTNCAPDNDGAFIKFDNLDVYATGSSFTLTITFNTQVQAGAIQIKSATNCFLFPLSFVDNCEEVVEGRTETAFAYDNNGNATCFLDMGLGINRWGWTNGGYAEGTYVLDLYAAAGQCDLSKGTLVGDVTIVYAAGVATVTYNVTAPYTLDDTHLYVGSASLPARCTTKKGVTTCTPTVAPGQYPNTGGSASYTVTGLSGNINVVAHAVVGGI